MDLLGNTIIGLFFGSVGTMLGGIVGIKFGNPSKKFLSSILALASGLMTSIACFDLIPEALKLSGISISLIGIIIGCITMFICDRIVDKKINYEKNKLEAKVKLLKTGIIIVIGLIIHNIPEGLAIGSGFDVSDSLGLSLAIAIAIHDIPEGLSMAVPMKNAGVSSGKIILLILLSGIATGVGVLLGTVIGKISEKVIAMCLAFSGGAMLYIVSGEINPEYNQLYTGKLPSIFNVIGLGLGIFVTIL